MPTPVPSSPVEEGDIIAGKYRVSRTLGVGGMGVVVAATHIELNHRVALKFLLPDAASNPDLVVRFAREARAAAQIQSEHVARVIDVGTLETGAPYMVMEYLDGQDVADALKKSGPLRPDVAVGYVLHACEAIAEAHAMGIVHRDLKPGNLFLARRPNGTTVVKVLDFGISKSALTAEQATLTHAATMVGSPSYMAPEQIKEARKVDARADLWSLGVILYELLSGLRPFKADSLPELIWVILDQPHAPLPTLTPSVDLPEGLARTVDRCLAKDPSARFANIADLAAALVPYGPAWAAASAERTAHALGLAAQFDPTEAHALPAEPPAPTPVAATISTGGASTGGVSTGGVSTGGVSAGGVSAGTPDPVSTAAPWSEASGASATPPPLPPVPVAKPSKLRLLLPATIGSALGIAVMGGIVHSQLSDGPRTTPVLPEVAQAPPTPPAPVPSGVVPAPSVAETPIAAPPPPVAAAPVATATSRSRGPATARPVAAPKPPSPSTTPHCATVSFFDSDGIKHFRQECK